MRQKARLVFIFCLAVFGASAGFAQSQTAGTTAASPTDQLFAAVRDKNPGRIKAALEQGADLNASDSNGKNALMRATEGGNLDIVKLLVKKGADVTAKAKNGYSPLAFAVRDNKPDVVNFLLDNGGNISDLCGFFKETLLDCAVTDGESEVAKALIQHGENVNETSGNFYPPGTLLMNAISMGRTDPAKLLLKLGADVNAKDNDGRTALMHADFADAAKLLLDHGANVNAKDNDGSPTLMFARSTDVLKVLLDHGANVNAKDKDGSTALMVTQSTEVAKILLAHGADVNAQDGRGKTALMHADSADAAKLLLDHGTDVNVKDKDGKTALFYATGSTDIAKALLAHGADPNAKDKEGQTPLFYAVDFNASPAYVKLLLQHGADTAATEKVGIDFAGTQTRDMTPLQYARFNKGRTAIAAVLEKSATAGMGAGQKLKSLLAELKGAPDSEELRGEIIALARRMRPKPKAPENIAELVGEATYKFKEAKSQSDYADAVEALKKATLAAPWAGDYYYNLSLAQEKAGEPKDAIVSLKLYLKAKPEAEDAGAVREHIGELEGASADQAKKQQAQWALNQVESLTDGHMYTEQICSGLNPFDQSNYIPNGDGYSSGKPGVDRCNVKEYKGSSWYKWGNGTLQFVLPGNGTVELRYTGATTGVLIGTPKGSSVADISWECPTYKDGDLVSAKAAWVSLSDDFSSLTYSCDRPAALRTLDDNETGRYPYTWIKRQ